MKPSVIGKVAAMPKQYDQQTKAQAVRLVQVPSTWPPSTSADGSSSQSCLCRDLMNHQAEVLHAGASLVVHVATDFSGERFGRGPVVKDDKVLDLVPSSLLVQ
jgi:hypothetical protein